MFQDPVNGLLGSNNAKPKEVRKAVNHWDAALHILKIIYFTDLSMLLLCDDKGEGKQKGQGRQGMRASRGGRISFMLGFNEFWDAGCVLYGAGI